MDTSSQSRPWQPANLGRPVIASAAKLLESSPTINGATVLSDAPFGPGSLTWRYLGDTRNALLAARAGILQVMHPAIDAGVREHSDFFTNPWNRIIRSAGPILGVVYDEDPQATGHTVRDFHRPIKGTMSDSSRYAALDPETYFWAHATFFEAQIATQELFGAPLSDAAKTQLYAESITWYERYGLSMRPVPADYAAFEQYWRHMLDHILQPTSIARASARKPKHRLPAPYAWMEGPVWATLHPLLVDGSTWLVHGTLPPSCSRSNGPPRTSGSCGHSPSPSAWDGTWHPHGCAGYREHTKRSHAPGMTSARARQSALPRSNRVGDDPAAPLVRRSHACS
jgi:uncharacterized protein (DUF2236 family)